MPDSTARPAARAIERVAGEAMRYCTNISCPAQVRERIKHYVSRGAMDIEGLGERIVDRFADLGFLHDVADIYHLDTRETARTGEDSARRASRTCCAPSRRARIARSRGSSSASASATSASARRGCWPSAMPAWTRFAAPAWPN